MKLFYILLLSLTLISCSSVRKSSIQEDTQAKQFRLKDKNKAGLYVFRDEFLGGAIKMNVFLNDMFFGATQYQTYLYKELKPGKYKVRGEAENSSEVQLGLKAGKLYFVWQESKVGFLTARNKLHIVDQSRGRSGVNKSKRVIVEKNNYESK